MSNTPATWQVQLEDALPYIIPIVVALAGYNWSSLLPGDNNAFLTGVAFGFLAKFLIGIQQNGISSWEDTVPTIILVLSFLSTALSSNPQYLEYGVPIGFIVKALGALQSGYNIEDLILALSAFMMLYGAYISNAELVSVGALLALIGKTVPSMTTTTPTPAPVTPTPAPAAAPAAKTA
jgi:hypothetical protein